ncbi:TPA: IS3 family transposase [Klebsiella pneumoniae]|nr:IS3 family transposase [Serratia marcescens]EJM5007075.1 IS3 family transposase [Salmonella enterica]EKX7853730.1 IS3 family transposase [Klebsiella pneumoniae]ELJ5833255.1 IS3 family transposase [Enterobacter kobei]MBJ6545857.1 IS3 family transposase [Enterobacter hormaechei]MCF6655244.1 IS3 family transposase [Raoultella ornithinolytica]MCY3511218.1 IS3 family transposase [Klebsiella michiganensis]QLN79702.1 IS3 family transposase [Klebsiella grimontii]HBM3150110.1 IS3 family transposa
MDRGCCYHNDCAENFLYSLKAECIHGLRFTSWDMMRATVFSYLVGDNNRWRRHSACSDLSPEQLLRLGPCLYNVDRIKLWR